MPVPITVQKAIFDSTAAGKRAISSTENEFIVIHMPVPPPRNATPGQLAVAAKNLDIDPIAEIRAIRAKAHRRMKAATEPLADALSVASWLESVARHLRDPFNGAPLPEATKDIPDSVTAALTVLIEGGRAGTVDLNSIADEIETAADAAVVRLTAEVKDFRRFQSVLSIAIATKAAKMADDLNERFPSPKFKALADGYRKKSGRMKAIHRNRASQRGARNAVSTDERMNNYLAGR